MAELNAARIECLNQWLNLSSDIETVSFHNKHVRSASVDSRLSYLRENMSSPTYLNDRSVSGDSGLGSLLSLQPIAISESDCTKIANELGCIYQQLCSQITCQKNLPVAKQAVSNPQCQPLMILMDEYGLTHHASIFLQSAQALLVWCETVQPPSQPKALISAMQIDAKLRSESIKLTEKVDRSGSMTEAKKALKKNQELRHHKEQKLKPAQQQFDATIYTLIDQQQASIDLKACLHIIKAQISGNVEVNAPIDHTIRTWVYNVLLERSRAS